LWNNIEIGYHNNNISTIRFSPDGNFLVSGSFDGIIKIWDVKNNWKLIKSIDIGMKQLRYMEFYPDYDKHNMLIVGGANLIIKLINMEKGENIGRILKTVLLKVECPQSY
jgi:katanin p80 WD40 repeat-containing subunit B1